MDELSPSAKLFLQSLAAVSANVRVDVNVDVSVSVSVSGRRLPTPLMPVVSVFSVPMSAVDGRTVRRTFALLAFTTYTHTDTHTRTHSCTDMHNNGIENLFQ